MGDQAEESSQNFQKETQWQGVCWDRVPEANRQPTKQTAHIHSTMKHRQTYTDREIGQTDSQTDRQAQEQTSCHHHTLLQGLLSLEWQPRNPLLSPAHAHISNSNSDSNSVKYFAAVYTHGEVVFWAVGKEDKPHMTMLGVLSLLFVVAVGHGLAFRLHFSLSFLFSFSWASST